MKIQNEEKCWYEARVCGLLDSIHSFGRIFSTSLIRSFGLLFVHWLFCVSRLSRASRVHWLLLCCVGVVAPELPSWYRTYVAKVDLR